MSGSTCWNTRSVSSQSDRAHDSSAMVTVLVSSGVGSSVVPLWAVVAVLVQHVSGVLAIPSVRNKSFSSLELSEKKESSHLNTAYTVCVPMLFDNCILFQ